MSKSKIELKNIPGKQCPNCGQIISMPIVNELYDPYFTSGKWEETPHANPFDCIKYLKSLIDDIKYKLDYDE